MSSIPRKSYEIIIICTEEKTKNGKKKTSISQNSFGILESNGELCVDVSKGYTPLYYVPDAIG